MRSSFRGYYSPSAEELEDIWKNGLIVLDTNALLNLFRYTQGTRDEFLAVLSSFRTALWIPHRVGFEFHRRRLDVIQQQEKAFDEVESSLSTAKNGVAAALKKFERHPSLNSKDLTASLDEAVAILGKMLATARGLHKTTVVEGGENERTFELVTELFEGCVGSPFSEERLGKLYSSGADRYAKAIPPGYKDAAKPEPDRYGDLILWEQILEKAREAEKPAIFITDDSKEDWWYIVNGKTQGARVELVDEYFAASGHRVHFYAPDRFLSYAVQRGGSQVSSTSLTEVEQVSSSRSAVAVDVLSSRREELLVARRKLLRRRGALRHETRDVGESRARLEGLTNDLERLREHRSVLSAQIEEWQDSLPSFDPDDPYAADIRRRMRECIDARADIEHSIQVASREHEWLRSHSISDQDVRRHHLFERDLLELERKLEEVDLALRDLDHGSS